MGKCTFFSTNLFVEGSKYILALSLRVWLNLTTPFSTGTKVVSADSSPTIETKNTSLPYNFDLTSELDLEVHFADLCDEFCAVNFEIFGGHSNNYLKLMGSAMGDKIYLYCDGR